MDLGSAGSGYLVLLLARARANLELGHDVDAQIDLREVIRLDPGCAIAFQLLGEIALPRDQHTAAATFFRTALRLDPNRDAVRLFEREPVFPRGSQPALPEAAGRGRLARGTRPPVMRFGRYAVFDKLGEGGLATVHR